MMWLGMTCATTLISTYFPALDKKNSFQPWTFLHILSTTSANISFLDLLNTTGRQGYLECLVRDFTLILLQISSLSSSSTFRLNNASYISRLTTFPEESSYTLITLRIQSASLEFAWAKSILSSTKKRWEIIEALLATLMPWISFLWESFLNKPEILLAHKINK